MQASRHKVVLVNVSHRHVARRVDLDVHQQLRKNKNPHQQHGRYRDCGSEQERRVRVSFVEHGMFSGHRPLAFEMETPAVPPREDGYLTRTAVLYATRNNNWYVAVPTCFYFWRGVDCARYTRQRARSGAGWLADVAW